jgi:hypothetical protein
MTDHPEISRAVGDWMRQVTGWNPATLAEASQKRAGLLPPLDLDPDEYSPFQKAAIELEQLQKRFENLQNIWEDRTIDYENFDEKMMDFYNSIQELMWDLYEASTSGEPSGGLSDQQYLVLSGDAELQWQLAREVHSAASPRVSGHVMGLAIQAVLAGDPAEDVINNHGLFNPQDVTQVQDAAVMHASTNGVHVVSHASVAAARYEQTRRSGTRQVPMRTQTSTDPPPASGSRMPPDSHAADGTRQTPGDGNGPGRVFQGGAAARRAEAHPTARRTGARAPWSMLQSARHDVLVDGSSIEGAIKTYQLTHPDDIELLYTERKRQANRPGSTGNSRWTPGPRADAGATDP